MASELLYTVRDHTRSFQEHSRRTSALLVDNKKVELRLQHLQMLYRNSQRNSDALDKQLHAMQVPPSPTLRQYRRSSGPYSLVQHRLLLAAAAEVLVPFYSTGAAPPTASGFGAAQLTP